MPLIWMQKGLDLDEQKYPVCLYECLDWVIGKNGTKKI
jgi:hypothetical protein